ncbi:hypothetical protein [Streptococcus ovis]|uniref:hypothetical protein n=1 Tax=Streptococcus ovis TaxID=82806 RepID=UPI00037C502A|nr:hypothetical protein [Streptococcus ovis]
MAKKSYKAKRLAREAKKQEQKDVLCSSEQARAEHVQKMGQIRITEKWKAGKGKSRYEGKETGDNYKYITAEKSFRDISAAWRRFSAFVASKSPGDDLESLEDIFKYADQYLAELEALGRSAWTLTTYKAHLGKVFNVPTTMLKETPPRERKNATRSRYEAVNDSHIAKEKRDFFFKVGAALGLRKDELKAIKGTALQPKRAKNGLWYVHVTEKTKGGRERWAPIMAQTPEEEAEIIAFFQKAGKGYVFSGKNGTYRVPGNLDQHAHRAEYAKRVYLHYERKLDELSHEEKTFLRKELKGSVLDKFAEGRAAEALGHGHERGEFRKSYVYKLLS